ncbi:MAG: helix-turn-helix domain-containing protein [Sediminibacterium sp.]|nr:helix-turn-helix domain-containing protein [Sediminibacterium sp.]MBX9779791.1 helix-turn-helix domain-containing protein [Chitinophagaceae bacterium]
MNTQNTLTLVNPQNGNLAFKILSFESNDFFDHIQRNNYYSLIWIQQGEGKLKADFSTYQYASNNLLAFSPYQPFMLIPETDLRGIAVQFHPDFFCIHKHQQEVACNGVLFNNIYQPPIVALDEKTRPTLQMLIQQMQTEMQNTALAQYELLISYLKIFLITTSRLKTDQYSEAKKDTSHLQEPFVLQSLKEAIEKNYREKHTASDYASILSITPKALAKITKTHLNKTLTSLISERIIIEAKRELYLTNKPVKQIAYELGYDDEYYFSRFFKTNTDVSPQIYRNTVGFDRLSSLTVN